MLSQCRYLFKRGPTGPKKTKFKTLLLGTPEEQEKSKLVPENFNSVDFISDCKNKVKIMELINKHNLTLFQVRELLDKYDEEIKSKS